VRALLLPVSSVVVAVAVGAAFWLPLVETLPEFVRQPLTLQGQLDQAFSLAALGKAWVLPKSALSVAGAPDFASFAFTGLPALLLAAVAIYLNRSAPVWLASGIGAISLATALGPRPLLAFLRSALPFFSTMNLHVAFYPFCFAVAVLAGFGASELSRRSDGRAGCWRRIALSVLIVVGVVQMGLFVWTINALLKGRPFSFFTRQMQTHWQVRTGLYLCGVVIAVCVILLIVKGRKRLANIWPGRLGRFPVGYVLVVAAAGQLILFAWLVTPVQPARGEWFYPKTPLITALQNLQRDRRVLPVYHALGKDAGGPPVFAGKTAAIFGLRSGSGYESLLPGFTALLWRTVEFGGVPARPVDMPLAYRPYFPHNRLPIGLLEKLSVGLLVTAPDVEPLDVNGRNLLADERVRLVYEGADGRIYEDSRALPRAFLAPQTARVPDPESALRLLASPEFDARQAVIVSGSVPPAYAAALSDANQVPTFDGKAEITRERLNEVEVLAVSSRPAWLVLNDSWAAGWKAFVDGAEQPVTRVNSAFRGLVVPAGSHQVTFRYRPRFLLLGFRVSGGALLFATGFWLWLALRRISARRRPADVGKKKGAAVL